MRLITAARVAVFLLPAVALAQHTCVSPDEVASQRCELDA